MLLILINIASDRVIDLYFRMYMVLLCLHLFYYPTLSSWTQQYGDPASTNYIPLPKTLHVKTNWNYSVPYDKIFNVSAFINSPSLSNEGVIFIPFAITLSFPFRVLFQVRAVSPDGKELWVAPHDLTNDDKCAAILLTNTLYSHEQNMVIIGWNCAKAFPYYEKAGQIVALNATNGSIIWKTSKMKVNDVATITMNSDTVFLIGGYSCFKEPYTIPNGQHNKTQIIAVDLVTGKVLWNRIENHGGCTTQTKMTRLKNGSSLVVFPVNLPPGPYPVGDLLSLTCPPSSSHCNQAWFDHLKITYDAKFAFSDNGIMFGSYGYSGTPDLIFALDVESNQILFSNRGYCDSGIYPSGPAVDKQGYAYFR